MVRLPAAREAGEGPPGANAFGERLRAERERQKIGVRELSRQLGVSASMISQIELGRVMPSVNTLYAITSNLGLSLDELFAATNGAQLGAAAEAARPNPVQRADSRRALTLGSGVRWELLTSEPQPNVDFLRAIYDVGSESCPADALMRHAGTEYGLVLEGHLGVTVGFETHELEPGDSISFDSWTPHRLFNLADRPTIAIWVVVARRGDPRSP